MAENNGHWRFSSNLKTAVIKALRSFGQVLPLIAGTILLVSLIITLLPKSFYASLFSGHIIIDPLLGSFIGSISAGHPATSYIIGGELLGQGVGLVAVTAFLVAWVTVGAVQLPAEAAILGKKFAACRNASAFVFSIIVALLAYAVIKSV